MGVSRAEVVAPFGYAMGFIDSNTRELALSVDGEKVFTKGFGQGVFRSNIEEASTGMAWW